MRVAPAAKRARRDGVPGLRIGILGAARIAERAIVKPAHATGTRLVTVATATSAAGPAANPN